MARFGFLVWAGVVVGCGPGTPGELPVVRVSADELAREYAADPAACHKKYEQARVEVTGRVDSVRNDDVSESSVHVRLKPAAGSGEMLDVTFHLSQEPKLLPIVPGQTATVRGVFAAAGFGLGSGELVDPGPSLPATVPGLAAEANDSAAFRKKYTNGGVKVTGKLMEMRRTPPVPGVLEIELTIGDDAVLDRFVVCKVRASERTDQRYRLISLKRGDTVTVVGRVAGLDPAGKDVLTLEHAHVIP